MPELVQQLLAAVERLAELRDQHDIVVPELDVTVQGIRVSVSGKRLPRPDVVAVVPECMHGYESRDGACHHVAWPGGPRGPGGG